MRTGPGPAKHPARELVCTERCLESSHHFQGWRYHGWRILPQSYHQDQSQKIKNTGENKNKPKNGAGQKDGISSHAFFNYLLSYEIFISCSSVSLESCGFHWRCSLNAGELFRQGLHVLGPQGPPCLATKLPFLHSHWVGLKDDFLSCTESGGFEPILGLGSFQARLPVARKGKKLGRSWKSRRIRKSQSGAVLLAGCWRQHLH